MPGQFNGANLKQGLITAAPMFNAMAAGYSSGRGPYAYMDQGAAMMQEQLKLKRDQEAAAKAAAAFAGLTPGGMGKSTMGAAPQSYGPLAPVPKANPNSPHALGDAAMAALGKPAVKTAADPASIKAGLVARGLPDHVAEGFVMNMRDESGLNPGINEINPTVPGSRGGFGLYQLTGPRRKAYEAYAAERGIPLDDVDAQLDFLMAELQGPESRAAQVILSTKDAGQAGAAIVNEFLRPAEAHRASRAARYEGAGGGGAPVDPMADPYVQQLMQVMAMPGLTPEQQEVVKLQLQSRMNQLTAPQPGAEEEAARAMRARDADLLGYERGSPEWRQFVVTGEMPEPPKPGYTRMTPEQVATIPGLDPAKAYQVSPEGKIETIGGGGTTVNIDNAGGKFEEAFAKGDATTIETVYNAGLAASRNIARIDQLGALLDANPTGMGASIKQFAGTLGIPTDGLDEIQAAQALINSLVPEQRQPGSGPMSDADLALFKQSLPQLINQPGGNKLIVETMRAIAQYDAEGARIVQRLRAGELDRAGAFAALQNRVNPLAAVSGSTGDGTAPPPAAAPGGVIKYDQNGNVIP